MKRKLIIFGIGKIADVVFYYATEECGFDVVAFTVDKQYADRNSNHDIPVVPFEEVERHYPPAGFDMFVAVGYHDLNRLRETKCQEAKDKGYNLVSIISPNANLPKNISIGYNCFIMPPSLVHPCVTIKNNAFVWSGAIVGHHSVIEDNCWITSGTNISGNVVIGANTFLAINATIGHSVKVGANCFLGANVLITKDLAAESVVIVESTKPLRLNSRQFLKVSNFSNL
jgi:sugar O-acyltransferase (sialic acid O-acetyltransferase NeuD family)